MMSCLFFVLWTYELYGLTKKNTKRSRGTYDKLKPILLGY